MDASSIQAAYGSVKVAMDTLRAIINTKTQIAADLRVADALEQLGRVQDTLMGLRGALADLQEENHGLKDRLREQEAWEARAAKYTLVKTPGGAVVYKSAGPPEHLACPACFDSRHLHILQTRGTWTGEFDCPGCSKPFRIHDDDEPPVVGFGPRDYDPYDKS